MQARDVTVIEQLIIDCFPADIQSDLRPLYLDAQATTPMVINQLLLTMLKIIK